MSEMLVSVILPTFSRNQGGFLERSIQSVLSQSYTNFELLVADDGSVDGSKELIQKYCRIDGRIKHIRFEDNCGLPAMTTGKAFLKSKGDAITFAFDDAELLPNHLSTLVEMLDKKPDLGMVYGQAKLYFANGDRRTIGAPYDVAMMEAGNNHIPCIAVMIRRDVIYEVGWADPHFILKRFCDWDLWCRIARQYPLGFVNKVLAKEYGPQFSDSLGQQFSVNSKLLQKYVKRNRNSELLPNMLEYYDPFDLDFAQGFDADDFAELQLLLLEHHIKTFNISEIIRMASSLINDGRGGSSQLRWKKIQAKNRYVTNRNLLLMLNALTEYIDRKNAEKSEALLLVQEKQRYIDQQRKAIDEKQAFIDKQQKYIDDQQKYIDSLHNK